jgi:hypothetical protein
MKSRESPSRVTKSTPVTHSMRVVGSGLIPKVSCASSAITGVTSSGCFLSDSKLGFVNSGLLTCPYRFVNLLDFFEKMRNN